MLVREECALPMRLEGRLFGRRWSDPIAFAVLERALLTAQLQQNVFLMWFNGVTGLNKMI